MMVSIRGFFILLCATAVYSQQTAWGQCMLVCCSLQMMGLGLILDPKVVARVGQARRHALQDGFARIQSKSNAVSDISGSN